MLLQWTLLQLASLGIDDGNKNCTGSIQNLTPLIGTSPLIKPPPLLSQLLLPNTPAETSPAQQGCQNHSTHVLPAPVVTHSTASVSETSNSSKSEANTSTVPTQPLTPTVTSNVGSELLLQGVHGDTLGVTTEPALNTALASEITTPTSAAITTLTSANGAASMGGTDYGNMPDETTAVAPPTTPPSETSPKEVTDDTMTITAQTTDSATERPYQSSGDLSSQNEVFDSLHEPYQTGTSQTTSSAVPASTPSDQPSLSNGQSDTSIETHNDISVTTRVDMGLGETTLAPTEATSVAELPLAGTLLPKSISEVPVKVSGDTQASEPNEVVGNFGKVKVMSEPAHFPGIPSGSVGPTSYVVTGDNAAGLTQEGTFGLKPGSVSDTVLLATGNVPAIASGAVGTSSYMMAGDNVAPQQGTLGLRPGSDDIISAPANEHGLPPGVVAIPSYVLTGSSETGKDTFIPVPVNEHGINPGVLLTMGNEAALSQQAEMELKSPKDTVIPAGVPGITPGVLTSAPHVLAGENAAGHSQGMLELIPGSVISPAANGPGLTAGVVGTSPHLLNAGSAPGLSQNGAMGYGTGTMLSGSENLPGFATGVVGMPSHLSAAHMAALLPQGIHGLQPGSAHIGNPMHSHLQQAVPLEQVLAPIISALLVKEWQEHPQYRFGRSVNNFEEEENTKSFIKERQSQLDTRHRRSTGDLLTKYQVVKSVIDKFMDMRPKTQDFLVKQGVRLTARKVGEMLKSYGPQMKAWINNKLSFIDTDSSSSTVGDEVDNLVNNFANSLENYIETLPH